VDERDKRRIGEQLEPAGRPKAPGRLELLQRFVNTWNHDFPSEWDRLGTPRKAVSWLLAHGLISAGTPVSAGDAIRLREIREAIRQLAVTKGEVAPDPAAVRTLRAASSKATMRVDVDPSGRTALQPARGGITAAVATLLGIIHEAQVTGAWSRFKACRRCRYAFFDHSKNRSAVWCAMSICGNRTKNRVYRWRKWTEVEVEAEKKGGRHESDHWLRPQRHDAGRPHPRRLG
jgi:predicted RNA-binding Zn ribbon-like protein